MSEQEETQSLNEISIFKMKQIKLKYKNEVSDNKENMNNQISKIENKFYDKKSDITNNYKKLINAEYNNCVLSCESFKDGLMSKKKTNCLKSCKDNSSLLI